MSFSSDLWKGFDILRKDFISKQENLKMLFNLFLEISNLEMDFSNGLNCLYNLYKDQSKEPTTFSTAVTLILENINIQGILHKERASFIKTNVLKGIRELLVSHITTVINDLNENNSRERQFNETIETLISAQDKFHNDARELSLAIADTEMAKDNENLSKTQKNKFSANQNKKLEIAKNSESEYIELLIEANKERENFNFKTKKLLEHLEQTYSSLITLGKWSLLSYIEKKQDIDKKLNIENEALFKAIQEISPEKDIKDFIETNATKQFPYYKIEFVPIKPSSIENIITQNGKSNNKDIINTVKKFICKELKYNPPKEDEKTNSIFQEISNILDQIWKEGSIDEIKKKAFLLLFNSKININFLIKCLNQFRSRGNFIISEKAYDIISEVFEFLLDQKQFQDDSEVLGHIIILSQTFYKIVNDPKVPQHLIQYRIQNHKIWSLSSTWKGIIKYSIGDQDKKKRNTLFSKNIINEEKRSERLKKYAENTLVNYLVNIKSFNVRKEVSDEIEEFFCKVYGIDREYIEECNKLYVENGEGGKEGVKKEIEEMEEEEKMVLTEENKKENISNTEIKKKKIN